MFNIPQSAAYTVMFKAFLATDHVTEATGKTIVMTISKAGGAFATLNVGGTVSATEVSGGWYKVSLDTTDTNTLGALAIRGAEGTIDDVGLLYNVTDLNAKIDAIDDFLDTEIAAIKAKTDALPTDPADASDIAASFTTVNTKLDTIDDFLDTEISSIITSIDALPTNAELATALGTSDDAVLAAIAALSVPTAAANAAAVWAAATRTLTANTNLSILTGTEIADALLTRDMSAVSEGSGRTPLQAFRMLRNKWSITAGTLTVTKENDTTTSWSAAVTGTAGADPITTVDPA